MTSTQAKLSMLGFSLFALILIFFKGMIVTGILTHSTLVICFEFVLTVGFIVFGLGQGRTLVKYQNKEKERTDYLQKLNNTLIAQSRNELFYTGNINLASMAIVRDIAETIDADRASIWIFDPDGESIICQQLYLKEARSFEHGAVLTKKDFSQYFEALHDDPIVLANDALAHPATKCFTDSYLNPLGIKSMLDVPIWFRGGLYGVICIESKTPRVWEKTEVDFAQLLSSLYSFARSVKETNAMVHESTETDRFIDSATLVSKADVNGKITYVNQKFEEVSGWTLAEVLGKDHHIVNSGTHPKEFWKNMYKKVIKDKKIWNDICVNRTKSGDLYWVDTYIKGDFDPDGNFTGFTSIRQDITELKRKEIEISNRMDAINRSNAVIEFDTDGNIKFANDLFLNILGYSQDEIIGKNHNLFVEDDVKTSKEYKDFWKSLREGQFFSGEIIRRKKDGALIYLQATYNPIIGSNGTPYRIMKIATDITENINQQREIEKKNTYLEHAAKIIRHDMHSGINTYIPRGVSSLERRLTPEIVADLKLEAPLRMLKEGLKHSQKVYKGVFEFTNLVKKDAVLTRNECNIKDILKDYLSSTAYLSQVILDDNLPTLSVNEALFCTALDNLIRNGLKYNDSETKFVKIYADHENIYIEDNGRGMSQEDFENLSKPYTRKEGQKESGTGLGLNICIAILQEHRFEITCSKLKQGGTQLKINTSKK
jgi:PAS domain S-box-containing protein